MSFLERFLIDGTLNEGRLKRNRVSRMVEKSARISEEEKLLLGAYFLGYWLVQYSGYREDYAKGPEPEWFKRIFNNIPPLKQVIKAAEMTTRIGRELIEESADLEYIYKAGDILPGKEIRSLANLLAGVYTLNDDDIAFPEAKLDKKELVSRCLHIIDNWFKRPTNHVDIKSNS